MLNEAFNYYLSKLVRNSLDLRLAQDSFKFCKMMIFDPPWRERENTTWTVFAYMWKANNSRYRSSQNGSRAFLFNYVSAHMKLIVLNIHLLSNRAIQVRSRVPVLCYQAGSQEIVVFCHFCSFAGSWVGLSKLVFKSRRFLLLLGFGVNDLGMSGEGEMAPEGMERGRGARSCVWG